MADTLGLYEIVIVVCGGITEMGCKYGQSSTETRAKTKVVSFLAGAMTFDISAGFSCYVSRSLIRRGRARTPQDIFVEAVF